MRQIVISVLTVAAALMLALAPAMALTAGNCCPGQPCCGQACCHNM